MEHRDRLFILFTTDDDFYRNDGDNLNPDKIDVYSIKRDIVQRYICQRYI